VKRSCLLVVGVGIGILALLSKYVWVPDVMPKSDLIVGEINVREGEWVGLCQVWGSDGYWTGVRHKLPSGEVLYVVGDPDTAKVWKCQILHIPFTLVPSRRTFGP
jgi:hypothetical protein